MVLYFYPKDDTRGCTAEACAFRDSYEVFTDSGADVIGISSDSPGQHAAFASKHRLPFTLLSDQGGQIRKRYGVPAVLGLLPGRVTYVIDRQGVVRQVFNSMTNISGHVSGRPGDGPAAAGRPAGLREGACLRPHLRLRGHQASAARAVSLRSRPMMSVWTTSAGCAPLTVNIHSRPA